MITTPEEPKSDDGKGKAPARAPEQGKPVGEVPKPAPAATVASTESPRPASIPIPKSLLPPEAVPGEACDAFPAGGPFNNKTKPRQIHKKSVGTTAEKTRGSQYGSATAASAESKGVNVDGQVLGAAYVAGHQTNIYNSPTLEDDLTAVSDLLTPHLSMPEAEVGERLEQLLSRRILLLRHTPPRQQEAESAMRAVLLALRVREPDRKAYCSGLYGKVQLDALNRSTSWRKELKGTVIYLYRDDPATLNFFATVERVIALCKRLEEMNCHLVLTAQMAQGFVLRDDAPLSSRIAVWAFEELTAMSPAAAPAEPSTAADGEPTTATPPDLAKASPPMASTADDGAALEFSTSFEITLAMLASMFPGLALREFTDLVDRLQLQPPARETAPSPTAAITLPASTTPSASPGPPPPPPPPPTPLTRHERWWAGARDDVMHELGISLLRPSYLSEEGAATWESGIYFETAERRADVQAWLYRRAPIRLSESLEALTCYYLSPAASIHFCVAYRRLLRALDTTSIHRLTSEWLVRHFHDGLNRIDQAVLVPRLTDLLSEWPSGAEGEGLVERVIDKLGDAIADQERELAAALQSIPWFVESAPLAPVTAQFWAALLNDMDIRDIVLSVVKKQAVVLDLLMSLVTWFPVPSAKALGTGLAGSLSAYDGWPRPDVLAAELPPVVSLARGIFRDLQIFLLRKSPGSWVALAQALDRQFSPPVGRPARGVAARGAMNDSRDGQANCPLSRWLLWECAFTLTAVLEAQPPPSPPCTSFVSDDLRLRTAQALAAIWRATMPSSWGDGIASTEEVLQVNAGNLIWVYHLMAIAVQLEAPADVQRQSRMLGELLAPVLQWLTRPQRIELIKLGGSELDLQVGRRDLLSDHHERTAATRQIQTLQLLMRLLRSPPPTARS